MFLDNLTIAGLLAAGFFALLPLLFGRESLKVEDDDLESTPTALSDGRGAVVAQSRRLVPESATETCGDS